MRTARCLALAARAAAAWLCVLSLSPPPASAWTVDEHHLLADSALSVVLADLGGGDSLLVRRAAEPAGPAARGTLDSLDFGGICAWGARDDRSPARYHRRGRTILEALEALTAARLDSLWARVAFRDPGLLVDGAGRGAPSPRKLGAGNVVAGYLEHHLIALRLAREAGTQSATRARAPMPAAKERDQGAEVRLRDALVYEALAQGFLADAFSAGHLVPPDGIRLAGLHPLNRRHLHDHYSNRGVYVLSARGETWQTFGDRLLLWYGPSFAHVFEACVTSLREVLLTWRMAAGGDPSGSLAAWADSIARSERTTREDLIAAWGTSRDGPAYLAELRLPTLMQIPVPVVATWSVRTGERDGHGLRRRHHYPQLSDAGGHDPTLDAGDIARLPRRAAVPAWMIPDTLFKVDPLDLVRWHPDFASARYAQPRSPRPSYTGLVAAIGETRYDDGSGGGADRSLSLGFSPAGETPILVHRFSIDGVLMSPIRGSGPRSAAVMAGADLKLPGLGIWHGRPLRWLENVRFAAGHAWTRGASRFADGPRYTLGVESPVLPLRFTFAAVTLRIEGQWTRLLRPRRGLSLQIVMQ